MSERNEVLELPLNSNIRFETPEGDYEGCVQSITCSGFIEVDATLLPDEDYLGILRFHYSEILSFQILSAPHAVTEDVDSFSKVRNKQSTADAFDNSDDDLDAISVSFDDQGPPGGDFVIKLPPAFSHLPTDFMIIDKLDENFESAIAHLKDELLIGLTLEGDVLGRHGTLSWLCISSSKITYLFDSCELKHDLFNQGIRDIMQDANIVKVIHDCRLVSDMLLHQYDTKLANVFDTQVADKYVETQRKGPGPVHLYVSSLNSCLRSYLEIPEEFLYRPMNRRFDHLFYQRPPSDKILDIMTKNVIYLRSLKEKLEDSMLEQFQDAVETNLQVLPSSTNEELLLDISVPERLPSAVTMKGIRTIKSNHYHKDPAASDPLESKQFFRMLHKYSEGKWSDSGNEVLPSKISNSDSVPPPSNPYESLGFRGINYKPKGSISEKTPQNGGVLLQKFMQATTESDSFSKMEADHKANGTCFSDRESSECESISSRSCECSTDSYECSYSEEESDFSEKRDSSAIDPWERLRAEMSEHLCPLETNLDLRRRLIPAGKQQY